MRKYVYPSGIRTTSPQNLSLHVHSTQLSIDIVCSKSSKHLCNVFSLVWLHSKDKTSYGFATRNTSPHEWEVNLHNPVKLREIVRFPHLSYPCFKALTPIVTTLSSRIESALLISKEKIWPSSCESQASRGSIAYILVRGIGN